MDILDPMNLAFAPLAGLSFLLVAKGVQAVGTCANNRKERDAFRRATGLALQTIDANAQSGRPENAAADAWRTLDRKDEAGRRSTNQLRVVFAAVEISPDRLADDLHDTVDRKYGGQLAADVRRLGFVAVQTSLATTAAKLVWSMAGGDGRMTTALIGAALVSTAAGAAIAVVATGVAWAVERSVKRLRTAVADDQWMVFAAARAAMASTTSEPSNAAAPAAPAILPAAAPQRPPQTPQQKPDRAALTTLFADEFARPVSEVRHGHAY